MKSNKREFNKPPRPDNINFCKSDDFCVWPPLLEKRRGKFWSQNFVRLTDMPLLPSLRSREEENPNRVREGGEFV